MELECNLLDYEKITDKKGIRQVFFGSEAGQAGMIDTLWALGLRLNEKEIGNPFIGVRQAPGYRSLTFAETALEAVGREIASNGLADEIHPVVFGFAGYGNVSKGAQEILNHLPVIEISPDELLNPNPDTYLSNKHVYKVVFYEKDMVEPVDDGGVFELKDYYDNPEKYRGVFSKFIPHLTVLMNCIFWTDDYPRLLVKDQVVEMYSSGDPKLIVIGDISCDIDGAVEVTVKATDSGNPIYVYDVDSGEAIDGVKGNGPVILAVDNLPCELPREASTRFSGTLRNFIPDLVKADFSVGFDQLDLPEPLKRSVIVYHGKLTPEYEYLNEFLNT
jgi:alpha-aminoadipic semialdehyde synthase